MSEYKKMKSFNKILLTVLIVLSLFLMIEMDVFHHHKDNRIHNECPVCVLNTAASAIAIITVSIFILKPVFRIANPIPVYTQKLIQNHSSYYYPDRAPPLA